VGKRSAQIAEAFLIDRFELATISVPHPEWMDAVVGPSTAVSQLQQVSAIVRRKIDPVSAFPGNQVTLFDAGPKFEVMSVCAEDRTGRIRRTQARDKCPNSGRVEHDEQILRQVRDGSSALLGLPVSDAQPPNLFRIVPRWEH